MSLIRYFFVFTFLASAALAEEANWTGHYKPCLNSPVLLRTGHMSIGVRYDVSDPAIIRQFHRAFEFWADILDAEFHDDPTTSCSIAVVAGSKDLLGRGPVVARAQLPGRLNFHGWIAVDPKASTYLTNGDAIAIWTHEIGHLLGLQHNPSASSIMYFLDIDATSKLDRTDLNALSQRHTLRRPMLSSPAVDATMSAISSVSLTWFLQNGSADPDPVPTLAQSR